MKKVTFGDALRGYAHAVLKRDDFTCRYCGLDGKQWPNWLYLSWDHLLPVSHANRDDPTFIVAACRFCNEASNRTKWQVEGKSPEELVAQKTPFVSAVRERYKEFWEEEVQPCVAAEGRLVAEGGDFEEPSAEAPAQE